MTCPEPNITVNVDLTNPGQFFACCGLLELADRLWPGAKGWFDLVNQRFCLHSDAGSPDDSACHLYDSIMRSRLSNTMSSSQVERREALASMTKREREFQNLEEEKKTLDKLWRESPLLIGAPFNIRVDWFLDELSEGNTFKTWAGQQSVIDIATAMKASIEADHFRRASADLWLSMHSRDSSVPFNFDAVLGDQGSDLDVGFSRDPLKMSIKTRPFIEFLAFVGLQRCRPSPTKLRNRYRYSIWVQPLEATLSGVVTAAEVPYGELHHFEFSLLYRTKYLKSFLPATPIGEDE